MTLGSIVVGTLIELLTLPSIPLAFFLCPFIVKLAFLLALGPPEQP